MAWFRSPKRRSAEAARGFPRGVASAALALIVLAGCGGASGAGDSGSGPSADVTAPTIPQGLVLWLAQPNAIGLSWLASDDEVGVAGYRIYRDGDYLTSVAGVTATDTGLGSTTAHCYAVSAFDLAGNESARSAPACLTTGDGVVPSAPTDVAVAASLSGRLDLSWSAATDDVAVTGYRVYRDGTLAASVSATAAVVADLAAATRYCFTVSAIDATGNESAPSAPACATTLWAVATITCVPSGAMGSSGGVALDSQGKVHVAYVGWNASLDYASNESGPWVSTLVKQGTTEGVADVHIALDSNDGVHLSYYSFVDFMTPTKDLKYATNAGGSWSDATIDSTGDVGNPSSIAVGAGNQVHISYSDTTNARVKHATGPASGWATTPLDMGGPANGIALAPNGDVHVVYGSNAFPYPLKHALISGGTPTISTLATPVFGGAMLAFDPAGRVHVGYRSGYVMQDATLADGAWTTTPAGIDSIGDVMVIDGQGKIHFYAASNYFPADHPDGLLALLHYTNASGAWTESISVIDVEHDASVLGLAVGADGNVHVVYRDTAGACLKYAVDR